MSGCRSTPAPCSPKPPLRPPPPPLPRELVSDFSDTGKECHTRARIEFQRRFLGSTSDTLLPECGPVVINERQLVATLLDLRTARGGHLTQVQRTQAQAALRTRYIAFFKQFKRQEREKSDSPPARGRGAGGGGRQRRRGHSHREEGKARRGGRGRSRERHGLCFRGGGRGLRPLLGLIGL